MDDHWRWILIYNDYNGIFVVFLHSFSIILCVCTHIYIYIILYTWNVHNDHWRWILFFAMDKQILSLRRIDVSDTSDLCSFFWATEI